MVSLELVGQHQLMQAHARSGVTVASSSSGTLFSSMQLTQPAARLLVESTARAQQQKCGDGGLRCCALACGLVRHAIEAGAGSRFAMRLVGEGAHLSTMSCELLRDSDGRELSPPCSRLFEGPRMVYASIATT